MNNELTVSFLHSPETKTWSTQIHVLPGTHHFKFIVDEQWRIADEYPTAVDDLDGSLANYVNASSPTSISPSSSSPQPTPHPSQVNQFASFWSEASSSRTDGVHGRGEAAWTTVIPQELINAAGEEENYLASADSPTSTSSIPAPNIPPAPVLPRHLDKLILNVRPQISSSSGDGGRRKDKERGKRRDKERGERESRARAVPTSTLGMTSSTLEAADHDVSPPLALPVVTASGTDVTTLASSLPAEEGSALEGTPKAKKTIAVSRLDTSGLADDASVLPVPSHVVLHHLSTSAIRNGVLAVANTTRYRKKVCISCPRYACPSLKNYSQYITTIYYKPT